MSHPILTQWGTAIWVKGNNSIYAIETDICEVPSGSHPTIQAAVDDSACSTINLAAATYVENVVIDRDLIIHGQSADTTYVDGNNAGLVFGISSNATVTITGVTIQGGYSFAGAGVANSGSLFLSECVVTGNTALEDGGGLMNGIYGTMIVQNCAIINNQNTNEHGGGGGGIGNAGVMYLTNVTVSGNQAPWGAGGISNDWMGINVDGAAIVISNATISDNHGNKGGIATGNYEYGGYINIQNSLIFGNFNSYTGVPQDCANTIISLGYNLIGTSANCNFQETDGDLVGVSPNIDSLMGYPPYHPLLFGPGIDAGNPDGCPDHTGELLTTDQRGEPRHRRCDIGAYEYDGGYHLTYLPLCMNNYCPPFFDNFSDPNSGWPVGESAYVLAEYLNGEYRVRTKQSGYIYLFSSPDCAREYYTASVDIRWNSDRGAYYGLLMGVGTNFDEYYLFTVSADYQDFSLLKRTSSGWQTIVDFTQHGAIHSGTVVNHLEATYLDGNMTLKINDVTLGTWFVGNANSLTGTGVAVIPYSNDPIADARFDNFSADTEQVTSQANNATILETENGGFASHPIPQIAIEFTR
ncbi:MAG: hypothetical protein H6667_01115 [Ardenticatenaceae bacterium]|nr:hypothetical protein [Ardenticatenaceae bacterium]MCB9444726.1 hypothetical protein [Ardenticatenaceae bacterium]